MASRVELSEGHKHAVGNLRSCYCKYTTMLCVGHWIDALVEDRPPACIVKSFSNLGLFEASNHKGYFLVRCNSLYNGNIIFTDVFHINGSTHLCN